jgi:hypothetical protein
MVQQDCTKLGQKQDSTNASLSQDGYEWLFKYGPSVVAL